MIEIRLCDVETPLDYRILSYNPTIRQLWSDGTLDGTYITKMVGYEFCKPIGVIVMNDGSVIYFTTSHKFDNGNIVIDRPYWRVEP